MQDAALDAGVTLRQQDFLFIQEHPDLARYDDEKVDRAGLVNAGVLLPFQALACVHLLEITVHSIEVPFGIKRNLERAKDSATGPLSTSASIDNSLSFLLPIYMSFWFRNL
jgi:hypothetical protein